MSQTNLKQRAEEASSGGSGVYPALSGEALRNVARQYGIDAVADETEERLQQRILDELRPGTNGFSSYP